MEGAYGIAVSTRLYTTPESTSMPIDEVSDYDRLRKAITNAYKISPEQQRQNLRQSKKLQMRIMCSMLRDSLISMKDGRGHGMLLKMFS